MKKDLGIPVRIRRSDQFDILWIRMEWESIIFLGVVYAPPEGSTTGILLEDILVELETDVIQLQEEGGVVLMGDFNCRTGTLASIVGGKFFARESEDGKLGPKGRLFMNTMNSLSMVVMNGVDGGREFTLQANRGSSVIDYLLLSHSLVEPGEEGENGDEELTLKKGVAGGRGGKSPQYQQNSMKVWEPLEVLSGEHRLVTLSLLVKSTMEVRVTDELSREPKELGRRWKRKGIGGNWVVMEDAMRSGFARKSSGWERDEMWRRFKEVVIEAQVVGMGCSRGNGKRMRRTLLGFRSREVENAKRTEKDAYGRWKIEKNDRAWRWFLECRRNRKRAVTAFRRNRREQQMKEIEELKTREPREFWRRLNALRDEGKEKSQVTQIKSEDGQVKTGREMMMVWEKWFRKLFHPVASSKFDLVFKQEVEAWLPRIGIELSEDIYPELNVDLTRAEVMKAMRRLKGRKAVGIDEITGEALRFGGEALEEELWRLLSCTFADGKVPTEWGTGLIVPVFKGKGCKLIPDNYRGITLLCVASKLYASILSNRLMVWAEKEGILADEQGGFRKGRGTVDQIFILTEIVRSRFPRRTYACFIDLRKAYDSVWRAGLWRILWDMGVRGRMWRALKGLYAVVRCVVHSGGFKSEAFDVGVGLKQGCPLSCILFLFFINGLLVVLRQLGLGVKIGRNVLSSLAFADDVVLVADSLSDSERLFGAVEAYCEKWELSMNYDKCALLVFNPKGAQGERAYGECKGDCKCGSHWKACGQLLKIVNHYLYLGVVCDSRLSFREHRSRVATRARGAMVKAFGLGAGGGFLTVGAAITLWEALGRSVLDYGAEVWGEAVWEEGEVLQREVAKRILRVNKYTANEGVMGELGWIKLAARRDLLRLNFWLRVLCWDLRRLGRIAYGVGVECKRANTWAAGVHRALRKYHLEDLWNGGRVDGVIDQPTRRRWSERIKVAVWEFEEKEWLARMQEKKKLSEYRAVKTKLQREAYLGIAQNSLERKMYTQLRLGCLQIRVETGRWIGEKREDRLCMVCMSGKVETERHCMLECPMYDDLREEWWRRVAGGVEMGEEGKWGWLMGKEGGGNIGEVWRANMWLVGRIMGRRRKWSG